MSEALLNSDCVRIPASVAEPTVPTKPNKPMLIGLGLFASIGLGIGLVCLLEHIDHSVKVPEHVTHGLTLPLLGVVPRIRRTALTHRGGHLWTPGTPDSIEADAYRNVRASLLGIADKRGPIVTLLVTSAKAGEGKSTTALNLAATCARAGERTLLLDVDLRRPSLADVFIEPDPTAEVHGLVDVLRGELPWQRTVRHTEIPNLDFIPTGDTRDIPDRDPGDPRAAAIAGRARAPLRPRHPRRAGRAGPGRLPGAGPHRRRVAPGRPVGLASPDDPAPGQGDARTIARGHRGRRIQRAHRRHE